MRPGESCVKAQRADHGEDELLRHCRQATGGYDDLLKQTSVEWEAHGGGRSS